MPLAAGDSGRLECAHCHSLTGLVCASCKESPLVHGGTVPETPYCSDACWERHRARHEVDCTKWKQRRSLFRAAYIMRDLFYHFAMRHFSTAISRVVPDGNEIRIYENPIAPESVFADFPANEFLNCDDLLTVLTYHQCTESLFFTTALVEALFYDSTESTKDIRVLRHNVGTKYRTPLYVDQGPRPTLHDIWKITLRNDEVYVLDLAGAQFGNNLIVVPWQEYRSTRINGFENESDMFAVRKEYTEGAIKDAKRTDGEDEYRNVFIWQFTRTMDRALKAWEERPGGLKLHEIISLDNFTDWQTKRQGLLDQAINSVANERKRLIKEKIIRLEDEATCLAQPRHSEVDGWIEEMKEEIASLG
ncbi:MAG: hypothetical protein Q9165_003396 [Trypethelium subeluteriae]